VEGAAGGAAPGDRARLRLTLAAVDAVFAALADPTRRRVVETLAAGSTVTASALAEELPISRQGVAKHLAALRRARLVRAERVGRETRYSLEGEALEDAARWIARVGAEWDEHLGDLRRLLQRREAAPGR
jgi:DNA-binding transcriptional ArsR family regulator